MDTQITAPDSSHSGGRKLHTSKFVVDVIYRVSEGIGLSKSHTCCQGESRVSQGQVPEKSIELALSVAPKQDVCWVRAGPHKAVQCPNKHPSGTHRQGKQSSLLWDCFAGRTCLGHDADGEASSALPSLAVPAQAGPGAFHLGPAQWPLRENWQVPADSAGIPDVQHLQRGHVRPGRGNGPHERCCTCSHALLSRRQTAL